MTDLLQLTYGSQAFATSSSQVNVFVLKGDGTHAKDFPGRVWTPLKGMSRKLPASTDGASEHGYWNQDSYEHVENGLLMIQASNFSRGCPVANGSVVLCLRREAPLLVVKVFPAAYRTAVYNEIPVFTGRADVIEPDDLASYGVAFDQRFLDAHFNDEDVRELYAISVQAPGTERPEVIQVVTPEGGSKTVAVPTQPRRRIVVKRQGA